MLRRIASVPGPAPKIPTRSEDFSVHPCAHLVGDRPHLGGLHHDDLGLEVPDQLHLSLVHAADTGSSRAEPLGAECAPRPPKEAFRCAVPFRLVARRGADRRAIGGSRCRVFFFV